MKQETEEMIGWEVLKAGLSPAKTPVIVVFSWVEPNWQKDADNVNFAKKFILDALVKQGMLQNDSRKNHVIGFFDVFPSPQKGKGLVPLDLLEISGAHKKSGHQGRSDFLLR